MPQSTKPLFNEVEQINSCYYISFTFRTYKANPKGYVYTIARFFAVLMLLTSYNVQSSPALHTLL